MLTGDDLPLPFIVASYRVSTDRPGPFGLGLEAQREAVTGQVGGATDEIVADYSKKA